MALLEPWPHVHVSRRGDSGRAPQSCLRAVDHGYPLPVKSQTESFDELLARSGPARARYLMLRLLERSGEQRVAIPALTSTDYVNTIPPHNPTVGTHERTRTNAWARGGASCQVRAP